MTWYVDGLIMCIAGSVIDMKELLYSCSLLKMKLNVVGGGGAGGGAGWFDDNGIMVLVVADGWLLLNGGYCLQKGRNECF